MFFNSLNTARAAGGADAGKLKSWAETLRVVLVVEVVMASKVRLKKALLCREFHRLLSRSQRVMKVCGGLGLLTKGTRFSHKRAACQ